MKAGPRRNGGERKKRQDEIRNALVSAVNAVENTIRARIQDVEVEVRSESVAEIVRARRAAVAGDRDPGLGLGAEARAGQISDTETIVNDVIDVTHETIVIMTVGTTVKGAMIELIAMRHTHKMRQKDSA
jgi:hypothetical protein